MRKLPVILGFATLILLLSLSLSSAYYYGGYYGSNPYEDRYDYNSYSSVRSSGGLGWGNTVSKNYDKITTSGWEGGSYVKSTAYVQTTVETPDYGYGGYGKRYNSYGNYNPWYQKYQPSYNNYNRYNSYPRDYRVNDYRPRQYSYSW